MKHKNILKIALLFLAILSSQISKAQTTIFNEAGGGAVPSGWTVNNVVTTNLFDRTSYWLLDAGNPSDNVITSSYDLSSYGSATLSVNITSFGSGTHRELKVEISTNGGVDFTQSYLTNITTGSYVTQTINITTISANTVIRLSNNGATGRGIRMQNLKLDVISTDPTVGFDSATSTENETNATFTANIPVTMTSYAAPVTVSATVIGGTAEAGDYTLNTSSLTFNANGTLNVSLDINPDADFDNETVIIEIAVTAGTATLGTSQHTITIIDDELAPTVGFDSATSTENETDVTFTSANIPITVANYLGQQININVSVTGGTAEVGDYTFTSPTALSFTANGTQNITVDINDDADTDNETIIFTITETIAVTGLVISQATHTLTIVDDEAPASYSGVGSFVKITDVSEIVDDSYYVLVDETQELFAMNNTYVNSTYLDKTDVTPASNTLTDPATSIVWEIKTNGGGKSIFNAASSKYVSYTGSGNNIQIVDEVTTDNQRWTIAFVTDEFQISNLALTTRRLQYNSGSPRFAAYTGSQRDISIYKIVTSTTWTGNVDTDWATAGNWSDGVPTVSKNAIIPDVTNAPIIGASTNAIVFNLSVSEPNGIVINSGGSLIVNGTSTGNVTYTRNLPSDNWYLVSSPVVGQVYNNDYVTANGIASGTENPNNRGIGIYETGSDNWSYLQVNGAGTFNPGQGYSVKRTVAGDISFTGTINTSDVSLSLVTGGRGGINLVGNPYTSYINSATFTSTNNGNLNTRSIWIWNQGIGKYDVKPTDVESYIIAPAQGFFVRGKSANNIVFTKANQTNNADTFQKTSNTVVNLFMTDGSVNRYAKVYFVPNATTGYDNGYDGETFVGIEDPFDVFTNLLTDNEGKKYQVQSLPNSDYENMVIPVGISATAGKEIIFTAEALNLPEGIKVFLEDRLTNTMTRLDEINTDYRVTLTESVNGIGRFYLHTKASSVLSTTDVTLQNVSVYTTDKTTLRVVGLTQGKASLKLYNMLGKQVFATSFNSLGVKDLNLPTLSTGIYVVQLETESGKLNKKITLE
ncbi:MAG: hypothetical protein COZ74_05175 [Flavobacteriaceae bacterium CG_4_8_14_3_um_filter_31_8]|nr:MAG: hypothetical protein COZ74_05175 [Flavobacteriaceae bacterium CG_4_8_14_3_um_filter_31_8]